MLGLGTRYGNRELQAGLRRSEKVVCVDNGNRMMSASKALRRIMAVLPRAGITRIAEISHLTPGKFPIFQSSRPGIVSHSFTGHNTGAQGKGRTRTQAKISCAMESIESFCQEPRNEMLIRGSYDFLQHHHAIVPPWLFSRQRGAAKPSAKEPFMWTQALLLGTDKTILVPAEHVFFPFLPRDYDTRPAFITTSNGVASGSTYLEASIYALYELIERHYYGLWEHGKIRAQAFTNKELDVLPNIKKFRDATRSEFEIEILSLRVHGLKNLPMFVCWLVRPDGAWFSGSGCAPNFNMAIHRAVSEAAQAYAVLSSGTREDVDSPDLITSLRNFPSFQTLTRRECLKTAYDKHFNDLKVEYNFLTTWLKRAGFSIVTIANLSRRGLDIPVVKAIIPGLCVHLKQGHGLEYSTQDIHAKRFHFKRTKR